MLADARSALRQHESEVFKFNYSDEGGTYDDALAALEYLLGHLRAVLLVVLEAAEMKESRALLNDSWRDFLSHKDGLKQTIDDGQYENCESPALTLMTQIIQGLRISTTKETNPEDAWKLSRLEGLLRDTPALVHGRKVHPETELDLQAIMHDYLRVCFPEFRFNPTIGGSIKNFRPDCGIPSISAAIEFKIVHTKEQVARAFSGIAEDTAGYRGSKDWTRFYAVMQAQPFMAESRVREDMKRIGAATWIPIVVNGPTKRLKQK